MFLPAEYKPTVETIMDWKPRDWVEHSAFGVGQVSEDRGDRLDIVFVNGGRKTLLKIAKLTPAQPPPDFKFPHQKGKSHHSQFKVKAPPHSPPPDFDHLVDGFMRRFTSGFEGQDFHIAERKSKEEAARTLKETLSKDIFEGLLRDTEYAEVCSLAKAILQSTNMVFSIEKAKFQDAALKAGPNNERFAKHLFDLLYGSAEMEQRFTDLCGLLSEINVNKWTVATYYQFLASDGNLMFMKPRVMKPMAESLKLALNYKPEPNWLTYSKLQELSARVDSELQKRGLNPHSRIDVQGFIWASIRIEAGDYGKTDETSD